MWSNGRNSFRKLFPICRFVSKRFRKVPLSYKIALVTRVTWLESPSKIFVYRKFSLMFKNTRNYCIHKRMQTLSTYFCGLSGNYRMFREISGNLTTSSELRCACFAGTKEEREIDQPTDSTSTVIRKLQIDRWLRSVDNSYRNGIRLTTNRLIVLRIAITGRRRCVVGVSVGWDVAVLAVPRSNSALVFSNLSANFSGVGYRCLF